MCPLFVIEPARLEKKIIFEKTSTLLNSKIIIAKQSSNEVTNYIEKTLQNNNSKKLTVTSGLISSIISGYIGYLATKKLKNYLE